MERVSDTFLLVGRLLMAALFLTVGIPKLLAGYQGFAGYLAKLGMPMPEIFSIVAIAVEIVGAIVLILGVFHRLTALLLIAFVVIATALAHRFWEFPPEAQQGQLHHFLKNIALIGGLLFYYVTGPGAFALSGRKAASGASAPARA